MAKITAEGITAMRERIDAIDMQLLDALAERFEVCLKIGQMKDHLGIPMMQPARIQEVAERVARRATERGLSAQFAQDLWKMIIGEACRLESAPKAQDRHLA